MVAQPLCQLLQEWNVGSSGAVNSRAEQRERVVVRKNVERKNVRTRFARDGLFARGHQHRGVGRRGIEQGLDGGNVPNIVEDNEQRGIVGEPATYLRGRSVLIGRERKAGVVHPLVENRCALVRRAMPCAEFLENDAARKLRIELRGELAREPRLADTGRAVNRRGDGGARAGRDEFANIVQLFCAIDKAGIGARRRRGGATRARRLHALQAVRRFQAFCRSCF